MSDDIGNRGPSVPPPVAIGLATEHVLSALDHKDGTALCQTTSDGSVEDDVGQAPRSKLKLSLVLLALGLSLFIAALDATIVATAVPVICAELNSATGYTWIGGAYLLANTAATPIWGTLSDIYGRKSVMLLAVIVFFIASTICATAKTMQTLVAARAVQGVGGGGLILLVHICVSDLFSVRKRTLFMGLTEGVWAIAGGMIYFE